jgi:RNA polymerase sigma-70 factor (ECF subfamily)
MNEALTLLRRTGRDQPLDEDLEYEGPRAEEPDARLAEAQAARRIQKVLMGMRPADRAVIALRHFSDCSYEEIAHILGIDAKTVKSRLFEARQRMRTLLEDLRPSEGAPAP